MLDVQSVSKSYGQKQIIEDISFHLHKHEFFGIIGPNGSGKSTLLKQLSGIEDPSGGKILFKERPLKTYSRKDLAKQMAVLQQDHLAAVGFTVREVIEMGRFPFQNWFGEDQVLNHVHSFIQRILEEMNLTHLSKQKVENLSGGEKQRVALAKTMAQNPQLLMLDEPTTYLDIGHQIQLMERLMHWQKKEDVTVIAVLHDLNLAALYCDRILLLNKGKSVAIGHPDEILTKKYIQDVYQVEPIITEHPTKHVPQILLERAGEESIASPEVIHRS